MIYILLLLIIIIYLFCSIPDSGYHYFWTYSIRMRLLKDHPSRSFRRSQCTLTRRHWESNPFFMAGSTPDNPEITGEGVVGFFPTLSINYSQEVELDGTHTNLNNTINHNFTRDNTMRGDNTLRNMIGGSDSNVNTRNLSITTARNTTVNNNNHLNGVPMTSYPFVYQSCNSFSTYPAWMGGWMEFKNDDNTLVEANVKKFLLTVPDIIF